MCAESGVPRGRRGRSRRTGTRTEYTVDPVPGGGRRRKYLRGKDLGGGLEAGMGTRGVRQG